MIKHTSDPVLHIRDHFGGNLVRAALDRLTQDQVTNDLARSMVDVIYNPLDNILYWELASITNAELYEKRNNPTYNVPINSQS
jgi:hypothetical protein